MCRVCAILIWQTHKSADVSIFYFFPQTSVDHPQLNTKQHTRKSSINISFDLFLFLQFRRW